MNCIRVKGGELYDDRYDGLVGLSSTLLVNEYRKYRICLHIDNDGEQWIMVRDAVLAIDINDLSPADQVLFPGSTFVLIYDFDWTDNVHQRVQQGDGVGIDDDELDQLRDDPDMIEVPELIHLQSNVGRYLYRRYFTEEV